MLNSHINTGIVQQFLQTASGTINAHKQTVVKPLFVLNLPQGIFLGPLSFILFTNDIIPSNVHVSRG